MKMNKQMVKWNSTVLTNETGIKTIKTIVSDATFAGCLLTHAAHMIHGMHQMREFVDDLILSITTSGSMREIDFENAKLMEFLDAYDSFQEGTQDLTASILGCEYGEEEKESEE